MMPATEWSKEAIKTCKDIFKAAAFIVFDINDQITDAEYLFGSLNVTTFNDISKDVSKCLKDLHQLIEIDNFDCGKYA